MLFVDDEPMLLAGLRRLLRSMASDWTMRFADSGASALEHLEQRPADVVVSDVRMPGMDRIELLTRVRELYPGSLRLALSGQTELDQALAAVSVTHRFMHKPCGAEVLLATVTDLIVIRHRITNPEMQAFITHAEIGSHLLAFWGVPARLHEAVARHHDAPAHGSWTMMKAMIPLTPGSPIASRTGTYGLSPDSAASHGSSSTTTATDRGRRSAPARSRC